MDNNSLVSIIIPTYNRWPVVQAAVNSCLNQTHKNLEVIVVDDGSTDQTIHELKAVADDRLRLIERPHTGIIGKIRNIGLRESKGDWLAFLDSDDLWDPTKLTKQLDALLTVKRELAWCYTNFLIITDAGTPGEKKQPVKSVVKSGDLFEELLSYRARATLPSLIMSRAVQENVGWLDESVYHDDYNFLLRLAYYAPAIAVDEPLLIINKSSSRPWTARDSLYHHQQMLSVNKLVTPLARKRALLHQVVKNRDYHCRSILHAAKQARSPYAFLLAAFRLQLSKLGNLIILRSS